jgi:hypothetical protein
VAVLLLAELLGAEYTAGSAAMSCHMQADPSCGCCCWCLHSLARGSAQSQRFGRSRSATKLVSLRCTAKLCGQDNRDIVALSWHDSLVPQTLLVEVQVLGGAGYATVLRRNV